MEIRAHARMTKQGVCRSFPHRRQFVAAESFPQVTKLGLQEVCMQYMSAYNGSCFWSSKLHWQGCGRTQDGVKLHTRGKLGPIMQENVCVNIIYVYQCIWQLYMLQHVDVSDFESRVIWL